MGSISDKLTYLNETKELIRAYLESKGVTVADADTFRSYVTKLESIPTGGGDISARYNYFDNEPLSLDLTDNLTVAVSTAVSVIPA
jgi:hypothetical protein